VLANQHKKATQPKMSDDTAAKQQQLMEMGFDAAQAQEALTVCQGNMERAVEYLFSGGSGGAGGDPPTFSAGPMADATSTSTQPQVLSPSQYHDVTTAISQYSLDHGRSACTCIALTAAQDFLRLHSSLGPNDPPPGLTPDFLHSVITSGVQTYQHFQNAGVGGGLVEHMSAEEVLGMVASSGGTMTELSQLQLTPGGIRQGILTGPADMGMYVLLQACRQDAPADAWLAVVITKTPETVVACLPPQGSNHQFVLMDSHPRPGVVESHGGAYARTVTSLRDLVTHLESILPSTELGPDIPEMMAQMYNSFDLYPLVLKK